MAAEARGGGWGLSSVCWLLLAAVMAQVLWGLWTAPALPARDAGAVAA